MKNKGCCYCGTEEELRPYGPNGAPVCFDCAMATPERMATAAEALKGVFEKASKEAAQTGGIVALTDDGIRVLK